MAYIADKLDEARALIEKGWCQRDYALNAAGKSEWPLEPGCVCFCAAGAIMVVCDADPDVQNEIERPLRKVIGGCDIISWNDKQQSAEPVIDAFKKAAELARAEG